MMIYSLLQVNSEVHAIHVLKRAWQPFHSLVVTLNLRDEKFPSPQLLIIYLLEHDEHSIIMTIGIEAD